MFDAVGIPTMLRLVLGNRSLWQRGTRPNSYVFHKDGMSLREEVAYLAENGLKASAPTISKWIKMLKDEESEQAA